MSGPETMGMERVRGDLRRPGDVLKARADAICDAMAPDGRPSQDRTAEAVAQAQAELRDADRVETGARAVTGAEFILDAPEKAPGLWGAGEDVAWAPGEPLMIVGPPGVGKTTLAQRLILQRAGVRSGGLLGMPVEVDSGRVLLIAADRPRQIERSFRRMVGERDREALEQSLLVWKGPLPFDLGRARPGELVEFVSQFPEVGTVAIDSLGAVATGLADDDVGGRINGEFQRLIAADRELVVVHHQRKATAENKRPTSLSDTYGSQWLTTGAGSVLLLAGQAGDPLVELRHLKQPSGELGPFTVAIDHERGAVRLHEARDLYEIVAGGGAGGILVREAAVELFGVSGPSDSEVEKARRKLDRLAASGKVAKVAGNPVSYRTVREGA